MEDGPPEYTPSDPAGPSTSSAAPSSSQPPPDAQRTNFLLISRVHKEVRGKWVIDPTLSLPAAVLPPLAEGETRLNAKLESANASVHGSIWIVPGTSTAEARVGPATVEAKTAYGTIRLKVVRLLSSCLAYLLLTNPSFQFRTNDHPVALTTSSKYGSTHLSIPQSFRGPVMVSTSYGSVRFSNNLSTRMTTFSEAHGVRRGFIGEHEDWMKDPDAWTGDRLEVEAQYGGVRMGFSDEEDGPGRRDGGAGMEKGIGGFFTKLFGGK